MCIHGQLALGIQGPLVPGPVPIEFYAVAIGVIQVDGLRDAMVRGAGKGVFLIYQSADDGGKIFSFRVKDGGMKETGRLVGGRRLALAQPGIQPDMMVIAAGRDKGGILAILGDQLKAQEAAIEIHGALQITYFQMHMTDARLRGYFVGTVHIDPKNNQLGRQLKAKNGTGSPG